MSEHWQYYTDDGLVHFFHNGIEADIDKMFDTLNTQDQRIAALEAEVTATKQMVERLIDVGNALDVPPDDFSEEQKEWRETVAEWRARNE